MANKLTSLSRFGSGDPKPEVVNRIKKAGSKYSAKHSLYSKKGFEHNKAHNAKHKALNKKTEHFKDLSGKRHKMTKRMKDAIDNINHNQALRIKRREDNY